MNNSADADNEEAPSFGDRVAAASSCENYDTGTPPCTEPPDKDEWDKWYEKNGWKVYDYYDPAYDADGDGDADDDEADAMMLLPRVGVSWPGIASSACGGCAWRSSGSAARRRAAKGRAPRALATHLVRPCQCIRDCSQAARG